MPSLELRNDFERECWGKQRALYAAIDSLAGYDPESPTGTNCALLTDKGVIVVNRTLQQLGLTREGTEVIEVAAQRWTSGPDHQTTDTGEVWMRLVYPELAAVPNRGNASMLDRLDIGERGVDRLRYDVWLGGASSPSLTNLALAMEVRDGVD